VKNDVKNNVVSRVIFFCGRRLRVEDLPPTEPRT
jgi:hypothetical protein